MMPPNKGEPPVRCAALCLLLAALVFPALAHATCPPGYYEYMGRCLPYPSAGGPRFNTYAPNPNAAQEYQYRPYRHGYENVAPTQPQAPQAGAPPPTFGAPAPPPVVLS